MAGIEQIVVHSKSYVIRWIEVPALQSISWSVEPHKKSINFGIFKHPGTKGGLTPTVPNATQDGGESPDSLPPTPVTEEIPQVGKRGRNGSIGKNAESTAKEKLESIGLRTVAWTGKCEADRVTMGRYDVQEREGGMFGLVFDNTFSRQTSKTVHFVLMTHPTDAPPKSGHHLRYSLAAANGSSATVTKGNSPRLRAVADSDENLRSKGLLQPSALDSSRPTSRNRSGTELTSPEGSSFYTGVLLKKRRKKAQGYAKRFFSLDFTSSTLSYYRDRHSSALRGAVPLSLAVIFTDEKTREFSIDSGAEVWHLKASNAMDFDGWQVALERAASSAQTSFTPGTSTSALGGLPQINVSNAAEDEAWQRVEQLVSKASGTRDALRGLARDTDPKYLPGVNGVGLGLTNSRRGSNASPSSYESVNPYFPEVNEQSQDRRSFWKRKPSAERVNPTALFKRSVSAHLAMPSPASIPMPLSPAANGNLNIAKRPIARSQPAVRAEDDVHERCMALLHDLDDVVSEFSALVAESKARRQPALPTSASRMSIGSIDDQEFFDAEDGGGSPSQLLHIRRESNDDDDGQVQDSKLDQADSDTSSDAGNEPALFAATSKTTRNALFPRAPPSLSPLPFAAPVQRRTTVKPPKQAPPSIIGFLRKNAGKDLSTVSMPVTANEPTSLLQRLAESMEYSQLLDCAANSQKTSPSERLMYVAAFAISYFANSRVKERAIRKPFNPMLHETFELVREDLGFRFVAEKVSHHPVRMACQAESLTNGGWSFAQSPQPVQKFWGKSVELNTEGCARVVLHATGECYSWSQATCFLRNVIAGEKYVEPVQSMTITCESSGARAVVTFKAGGMFSGRSEDVVVQLFDAGGNTPSSLGLVGKWTESLSRTDTGATIWTTGSLVPDAAKVYGFTSFAAAMNQVTAVEEGRLPGSDSRLRPDQLALEGGDSDKAEGLKARLEERQRSRRKVGEEHGAKGEGEGVFFDRVGGSEGEEVWMLRDGAGGYWARRERRDWDGIGAVFEV